MSMNQELAVFQQDYVVRINRILDDWLSPKECVAPDLFDAMRYAALNGGKRVRPLLVYTTGNATQTQPSALDHIAASVELIHCYSLIHDDLPAMDNDDLRRGKPACHKAFSEATAILAGDALQDLAFECIASIDANVPAATKNDLVIMLAKAIGANGMAGGQALDLAAENQEISLPELAKIHRNKTGALIKASILMPALCSPHCDTEMLTHLEHFADNIGLAFQIHDDVLDVEASTERLGKRQGADQERNKSTYVSLVGLETAKEMALAHYDAAINALNALPFDFALLQQLAEFIVMREH